MWGIFSAVFYKFTCNRYVSPFSLFVDIVESIFARKKYKKKKVLEKKQQSSDMIPAGTSGVLLTPVSQYHTCPNVWRQRHSRLLSRRLPRGGGRSIVSEGGSRQTGEAGKTERRQKVTWEAVRRHLPFPQRHAVCPLVCPLVCAPYLTFKLTCNSLCPTQESSGCEVRPS